MADITTKYCGLDLKNPFIVGSSGLTSGVDSINRLAKSGAAAVVLKSVFEEEILLEYKQTFKNQLGSQEANLEFFDYYDYQLKGEMLENTTELINRVKESNDIPVIASINCRSSAEWFSYAKNLEKAGADAIELNIHRVVDSVDESAAVITEKYLNIVQKVKKHVTIPVAVKMSPFFADTAHMASQFEKAGADALVMFNRYYSPDIDLENNKLISAPVYSNPGDYTLPLRWISLLSGKLKTDIAASTGIHSPESMIKMLVAGASAVQIVSALYKNGPDYLLDFSHYLEEWMDKKGFDTLKDIREYGRTMIPSNSEMFERVQFMKYFGKRC
ncbi:dihydroorotate dehydrogenase-like protein [Marinilabiliaceae bacterium ANBcel2]|nr:dihydroorotate dehydrogenase-like protein [Marinilabiliaceae bacterium ANBcel2]